MNKPLGQKLIPLTLAAVAIVVLYLWFNRDTATDLVPRLPGSAGDDSALAKDPSGPITGKLLIFDGVPSTLPGRWPRFRGEDFDNIARGDMQLSTTWPASGPPVLWSLDLGEGHAGAAVLNGCVYVLDYDRENSADAVRCLSLDDGREIWRYSYPVKVKRNHGMSRTTPAVTDKFIVTLGPKCHVTCLDSTTGRFLWMLNLPSRFKAKVPLWYAGQCPLIDDGKTIIATGGDALLVAVDCATGDILWRSPNPLGWEMTHSSIMPAEFAGRRMYVYCGSGGVAGISAQDGSILWQTTDWKIRIATIASPLVIGDGRIFLSGGYNSGSMMLKLSERGDQIVPEVLYKLGPEVFGATQHTPIFYEGYIYGVRPDGQLVCLSLEGSIVWTSTTTQKFGIGPFVIANGLICVMNDSGLLTLVRATPGGYRQLAQAKVLPGPDSWAPMAVASGRLILRDLTRMICLDISDRYNQSALIAIIKLAQIVENSAGRSEL